MNDVLQSKLRTAPMLPGCYLFRDNTGNVIYVGKAKVLRNRVRSYFSASAQKDERIQGLIRQIADVDFDIASSETDALIREYQLIKEWKPWYNSQLKRDTPHPFIRIDVTNAYPSITIVDDTIDDGAEYFGSFFDIYDAENTIEALNTIWRTPLCKKSPLPPKACLFHSMKKCSGACIGDIDRETYQMIISDIIALLRGERIAQMDLINCEINKSIRALDFEKAAALQAKLAALEKFFRRGQRFFHLSANQDAVVLVKAYHAHECKVFYIKQGNIINYAHIYSEMDTVEIAKLVEQCMLSNSTQLIEPWLMPCIAEIYADKHILRHSTHRECVAELEAIVDHIETFMGDHGV